MNSFVNNDVYGSTEIKRKPYWNYRLLKVVEDDGEFVHLVEMYYEGDDRIPYAHKSVNFEYFDDVRQIENALGLAEGALFKPVMFIDVDGKIKEKS